MRLSIIVNPTSGGGRGYRALERYVGDWPHQDWEVEVRPTGCPGHAGAIARELLESPPDLLAVCGGDGTINEVAHHVPAPPFPIALLPAGTANVLARELRIPLDPVLALERALRREVRRVDLGVVRGRDLYHFLTMAGIGFDAYVVSKVNYRMKKRMGMAAYYLKTIQCLQAYSFPEFQITADSITLTTTSCVISNARTYGGGLILTPEADMIDGVLDVIALPKKPKLDYLRFIFAAWRGKYPGYPWVSRFKANALKIQGPRGIWAHVDGELVGTLPLEVRVLAAAFPLVVGSNLT